MRLCLLIVRKIILMCICHIKYKTLVIALISFALGVLVYNFAPILFQEGNPWPEIKAISQLTFGESDMVKLSGMDNRYLTKSDEGSRAVDVFMRSRGYEFVDQMGSGYFYKSSGGSIVLTRRQYSRFYAIWNITESGAKSLRDELRECLPKSDTASHEKCDELLKQVTDYDSCVNAGFSIMKSNPPQCATPDGKTFVEGK